jgi:lipopolysaccharide export system permease protein
LYEFVPFAALIGALIGLGRLASASELVVARAAGASMVTLALTVLKPTLLFALAGFLVSEFITPITEQVAISERALAQRSDSNFVGRGGTWNRDGSTYIHVAAVQRGGLIFGVTLLTYGESRELASSLRADRGTFMGDHWLLENVSRNIIGSEQIETDQATLLRWDTEITPDLLVLEVVDNESLPSAQLWSYARFLKAQGLSSADVELAFWRKVFQPLAAGGLVLVAISFIFGPLREGNMGARIFAGVIVGVVFRISQDFFGPASLLYGIPAVVAAAVPIGVCWLAGGWLLLRRA